jgi:hypothetical protein
VGILNKAMTALFDLLLMPFTGMAPIVALSLISIVSGGLMLWIFGKVSNQESIRLIRDRVRGNLIAVRLFGDDLGMLFRLQWRLIRDNVVFLKYALLPLLIMMIPVMLILTQLNLRFESRPLETGEAATVMVTLRDATSIDSGVTLEAPDGITVETAAVRVAEKREVAWRIRPDADGDYGLIVRVAGEEIVKRVQVGGGWGATSALRPGKNLWEVLLYPGEDPIRGAVESIEVQYRSLPISLFGFGVDWLIFFFLVSLVAGFALKKPLGVEI